MQCTTAVGCRSCCEPPGESWPPAPEYLAVYERTFYFKYLLGKSAELSNPASVEATKHPQIWRQGVLGIICTRALQIGVLTGGHNF